MEALFEILLVSDLCLTIFRLCLPLKRQILKKRQIDGIQIRRMPAEPPIYFHVMRLPEQLTQK